MKTISRIRSVFAFALTLLIAPTTFAQSPDMVANNWHHWRGPEVTGVSPNAKPPVEWSEDKNIQWKVPLQGAGSAAPIVWENKLFLLTAIDTKKADPSLPAPRDQPKTNFFNIKKPNTTFEFHVVCLDRNTGKEIWRQKATENIPHEGHHNDCDYAPASPTTDGKRLYCWFGSAGLFCYDLNGKKLWERDLGKAFVGSSLGEGCSPVIHEDKLVIVRDHSKQSSIHVIDATNGETIWEKDRDEGNTWATPRIINHSGKTQVITTGSNMIRSYNLDDGEIIWKCKGLTGNCIPCPIVDGDLVLCMSGYKGYSLMAIPLSAKGDISDSNIIAWKKNRGTPYIPSPVLYDGLLYITQSNQSILTVLDSKTGNVVIKQTRLPGISNVYASPVAANNHVYYVGRAGKTLVLKKSKQFEVAATNTLNDQFDSSPAIAGDQLFLRGDKSLYCIAK